MFKGKNKKKRSKAQCWNGSLGFDNKLTLLESWSVQRESNPHHQLGRLR